jgi:nucleoid-associated protein YgaU
MSGGKMKKYAILLLALFLTTSLSYSQTPLPPASKPDAELLKKEAEARILDFKSRVENLQSELKNLDDQVNAAKTELDQLKSQFKDCRKEILTLIGASESDLDAFRQKLGVIEGKVRQLKGLSNDALADRQNEVKALEEELNQLRANKISVIPEFYDKIIALAREIKGLYREKKITTYTVGTWAENRDCLWNIAGKIEIYSDPLLWVKIWQNNTDKIKNPDIIFPGQVLTIPDKAPKTTDEQKAERRYWRNKRAQISEKTVTPGQ